MDVLDELIACCEAWEPDVCVLGNVRAGDAAQALRVVRADLTMAEAFHKAAVAQRNAAWAEVASLRAELAECQRQHDELGEAGVYLFNCGYRKGHHDTVEAIYVDIHDEDMRTYQSDVVVEVLDEAIAARKGEGGS